MASSKNKKSKSTSKNKSSASASRKTGVSKSAVQQPSSPPLALIGGIVTGIVVIAVVAVIVISNNNRSTPTPTSAVASSSTTVGASASTGSSPCLSVSAPSSSPIANPPRQFAAAQQVIDPAHTYCAFFNTPHGTFVVELYPKSAPKHVNSFVFLAQQGYFDGITWHRVIPGFMAQTGDPTGTGSGGPGYTVPLEIDPNLKYDKPGVLGMARTNDPNSAGSQFFITFVPYPSLDGQYTIFGQVVGGMNVVNAIAPRNVDENPNLPPGEQLISVRVVDATTGK